MINETQQVHTNLHKNHVWRQSVASVSFLIIFAILMPILLMNLLIGLAVGDIETVRRNASMKRLAMQIQHHTDLVTTIYTKTKKTTN